MTDSNPPRWLTYAATFLGIVTGVGTLIGWIAGYGVVSTLEVLLPIVALAFLAMVVVGFGIPAIYVLFHLPSDEARREARSGR